MGFDTYVSDINLETKECKNLKSAQDDPQAVREVIKKECDNGYAYGPFDHPPFAKYRVSPLGIAVGKYSGKKTINYRPIFSTEKQTPC